jgi:proline dehydrogenase
LSVFRSVLLWASENPSLRQSVPQMKFVRKALKKFMPGEEVHDAVQAAKDFLKDDIPTVFTHLGENLKDLSEAESVTTHYISVLEEISKNNLKTEISLKLTQLGFDLSLDKTFENFVKISNKAKELNNYVWIDMEGSKYTQKTLDFYKKAKTELNNIGLCLQAYLMRTENDLKDLLPLSPAIRLVKGAYKEPADIAFEEKSKVDENYLNLSKILLNELKNNNVRAAFGTHDLQLITKIKNYAEEISLGKGKLEFQMLYGIKSGEQLRLKSEGNDIRVLISYGHAWYPWYVRRLAERPANVMFVLKNIF